MMRRDIYSSLVQWKRSTARKPLILQGARQVGKTHILKHFGKNEYENSVYLNFERDPGLDDFFRGNIETKNILRKLAIYADKKINPGSTLLIFDEIQASQNALKSLKYFNEEANEYHIAAAGSLLGVKLGQGTPFPVGKVNFLCLYPLTFLEFLEATGKKNLRSYLDSLNEFVPIEQTFHEQLVDLLRLYFFIGGMPEAVVTYISTEHLPSVRKIQDEILSGYESDFSKYATPSDAQKIAALWESVPGQLARENKKFKYRDVAKNARARDYAVNIKWLADAGLINKSKRVSIAKLPLQAYHEEEAFKVYFIDTGLLAARLRISSTAILKNTELFQMFSGAFTENFVAQELVANKFHDLHFWASGNQAEVDFLVEYDEEIFPLEVKAGTNSKAQSLNVYNQRFAPRILAKTTLRNLKLDGKVCNFPLYAISKFPELIRKDAGEPQQLSLMR